AEAPLTRTMESLAGRRRVAVVVDGLDAAGVSVGRATVPTLVLERARELSGARLPFVAIVDPGATPTVLERNRVSLVAAHHPRRSTGAGGQTAGLMDRLRLTGYPTCLSTLDEALVVDPAAGVVLAAIAEHFFRYETDRLYWPEFSAHLPPS